MTRSHIQQVTARINAKSIDGFVAVTNTTRGMQIISALSMPEYTDWRPAFSLQRPVRPSSNHAKAAVTETRPIGRNRRRHPRATTESHFQVSDPPRRPYFQGCRCRLCGYGTGFCGVLAEQYGIHCKGQCCEGCGDGRQVVCCLSSVSQIDEQSTGQSAHLPNISRLVVEVSFLAGTPLLLPLDPRYAQIRR